MQDEPSNEPEVSVLHIQITLSHWPILGAAYSIALV